MTKKSERKKIVEAIISEGDTEENLKKAGFKSKIPPAAVESKSKKKKANL